MSPAGELENRIPVQVMIADLILSGEECVCDGEDLIGVLESGVGFSGTGRECLAADEISA